MTPKPYTKLLALALLAICAIAFYLIPPPISGRWRAYIPPYPSSEGGPKWYDLELRDGNMIYMGSDIPIPDSPKYSGSVVAHYSKIGFRKYRYTDDSLFPATLNLGWFRSTVTFDDEHHGLYFTLKRRFWKRNESTQQGGPGYPPQGVGSPDP